MLCGAELPRWQLEVRRHAACPKRTAPPLSKTSHVAALHARAVQVASAASSTNALVSDMDAVKEGQGGSRGVSHDGSADLESGMDDRTPDGSAQPPSPRVGSPRGPQ